MSNLLSDFTLFHLYKWKPANYLCEVKFTIRLFARRPQSSRLVMTSRLFVTRKSHRRDKFYSEILWIYYKHNQQLNLHGTDMKSAIFFEHRNKLSSFMNVQQIFSLQLVTQCLVYSSKVCLPCISHPCSTPTLLFINNQLGATSSAGQMLASRWKWFTQKTEGCPVWEVHITASCTHDRVLSVTSCISEKVLKRQDPAAAEKGMVILHLQAPHTLCYQ